MAGLAATPGEEGDRAFLAVSALLFVASAAATVGLSATSDLPICGGGTMSMAWRPMPGQTWPGATLSFLGMWLAMTAAMMLPSLVPLLRRYRRAVGVTAGVPIDRLTALVGAGYFCAWTGAGLAAFALGTVLPQGPLAVGAVLLMAGAVQFTAWKRRALTCCRELPGWLAPDTDTAWRYGLDLGCHCIGSSAGLTAVLLVVGMMDLSAMAAVTAAITVERLAPAGYRIAQAIGIVLVGAGLVLTVQGVGLG
jgi:predicted metal-binding membrane protein